MSDRARSLVLHPTWTDPWLVGLVTAALSLLVSGGVEALFLGLAPDWPMGIPLAFVGGPALVVGPVLWLRRRRRVEIGPDDTIRWLQGTARLSDFHEIRIVRETWLQAVPNPMSSRAAWVVLAIPMRRAQPDANVASRRWVELERQTVRLVGPRHSVVLMSLRDDPWLARDVAARVSARTGLPIREDPAES